MPTVSGPPTVAGAPTGAPLPPPPPPPAAGPAPRGPRRTVALLAAATLAGAAGGYVAATLSDDGGTTTASPAVVPASVDTSGGSIDVGAVVAAAQPSVVSIRTTMTVRYGPFVSEGQGAGTGIVLDDGYVLTNAHVVDGATEVEVTVAGEPTSRTATVVGTASSSDVALLRVDDAEGLVPATLGDSDEVRVGDPVVAIGNALGLAGDPTVTQGIVSAVDRSITTDRDTLSGLMQTDTAISSGNSGGPLLNADGEVIGINTAVAGSGGGVQASNVGFVIPINDAIALVGPYLGS